MSGSPQAAKEAAVYMVYIARPGKAGPSYSPLLPPLCFLSVWDLETWDQILLYLLGAQV